MKFRKPFYRQSRGLWYVQLDGKQINLGPDRKQAFERYKQLLLERRKATPAQARADDRAGGVAVILDSFLDWLSHRVAEGTKAQRTYDWHREYLQSFLSFRTETYAIATLPLDQLQPFHVYQWVDSHTGWKNSRRGAMTSVQRAFSWAAKAGLLKGTRPADHVLDRPSRLKARPCSGSLRHALVRVTPRPTP